MPTAARTRPADLPTPFPRGCSMRKFRKSCCGVCRRKSANRCARFWTQDPRPSYQDDPERVYGFGFAGMEVRFRAADGVLTVLDIQKEE